MDELSPKTHILIKGARVHNLKNIDLALPRNQLITITGLSGSGKSSLAFDTLYAEGQRRYVESLSSYARQFMGKLEKPEVTYIKGVAPAIAIQQKVNSRNPRSTVGTVTEVYDYLRVLYARIGITYSPISGEKVQAHQVDDVIRAVKNLTEGTKLMVCYRPTWENRTPASMLDVLQQQGYSRLYTDKGETIRVEDTLENPPSLKIIKKWMVIVDRAVASQEEENINRLADSIQMAFFEGKGHCSIILPEEKKQLDFSNVFEADGIHFNEPTIHFFSYNNPFGACPVCEGFGSVIGFDEDLVVANPKLSVYDNAVVPWRGEKMSVWRERFIRDVQQFNFPIHRPYRELTEEEKKLLWKGRGKVKGIDQFFEYLETKSYKIQYRVMLSRYRGKTRCHECDGKRLRKEAEFVKVHGKSITDLSVLPVYKLRNWFDKLTLSENELAIAKRLLTEITNRLQYIEEVGLGYLTLNRGANTLSGGESQRINLATSLGSSLVGSMYILDEPSIGLHPKDTDRLIQVIKGLKKLGNTVIVVEHDEEMMRASDMIVDIGPGAGQLGGEIIFQGTMADLLKNQTSLTGAYLRGEREITLPETRRPTTAFINVKGASENNLKDVDAAFPLNAMTVVTGVSGSGKSTLVNKVLYPALMRKIMGHGDRPGKHDEITGPFHNIQNLEFVDQNPIGKSSRSNPVTYLKIYDDIRNLYAREKLSGIRGYKPKHFSFNVAGGRCDACEGEGTVTISMQFMADVHLKCEECEGKRFKKEILEVTFHDKSISDILEMDVREAIDFFQKHGQDKIAKNLQPLFDVGLDYVKLGQSSNTLSGGEAQRVKLALFLSKSLNHGKDLYIFDEPTTGLHFHDIEKLMHSFNALIARGHTLIIIEHHPDVIKNADWIIDMGPEGGDRGGEIVYQGSVEGIANCERSATREFVLPKLTKISV
ncbi:MAG: excinuclease ABC subunit UvrA [Cryomorphaceae bacterium]|nr:excinuclease ABC subunit UvrA [Cryomorphaceae bacterium]